MSSAAPLYIGFDLSTQQLKGLVIDSNLKLKYEAKVSFDDDLSHYGIHKGVLTNPAEGEIFAPNAMWLEAIELVLGRLRDSGCDFGAIKGLSGAGMQHGTVFWSDKADDLLANLDPQWTLVEQLEPSVGVDDRRGAFSHPHSPNWQDASTQKQCDAFDALLGSPEELARVTGSKAHHRFSGPQIMRWHQKYPKEWAHTSRISLVSSFIASIFLGRVAPIDISDVCGMNLWDMHAGQWHDALLELAAGSVDAVSSLKEKLGAVPSDGGATLGTISPYFAARFGFARDCAVVACTGDNPATILALPLRANDAMVSLGTSTTFLMSTDTYRPDPAYHFLNSPTTKGLYMFMLCYKNGGLARERIRDQLLASGSNNTAAPAVGNGADSDPWAAFNHHALTTPPLAQQTSSAGGEDGDMHMGLFFPRPEIVPNVRAGQWRYTWQPATQTLTPHPSCSPSSSPPSTAPSPSSAGEEEARLIIESQMLSLRLRSQPLITSSSSSSFSSSSSSAPPPQARRIYLVGGGALNPAIAQIAGDVLGGLEGVYRLDVGGNACALGAAHKACWAVERRPGASGSGSGQGRGQGGAETESFDAFIGARWDEGSFVKRVGEGYRAGVFERYGAALEGFRRMEEAVLAGEAAGGV